MARAKSRRRNRLIGGVGARRDILAPLSGAGPSPRLKSEETDARGALQEPCFVYVEEVSGVRQAWVCALLPRGEIQRRRHKDSLIGRGE